MNFLTTSTGRPLTDIEAIVLPNDTIVRLTRKRYVFAGRELSTYITEIVNIAVIENGLVTRWTRN